MDTIFRFSGSLTAQRQDFDFEYFLSFAPDLFPSSSSTGQQAIYNVNSSFVIDGSRTESSSLLFIRDEDGDPPVIFDGSELGASSTFSLDSLSRGNFSLLFTSIALESSDPAALPGPDLPQTLNLSDFDERAFIEIDARSGDLPDRVYQIQDFEIERVQFDEGATTEEAQSIALLYETSLNRDGDIDFAGLNFWIDVLEADNGFGRDEIAQAFLDSPEFEASFGDVDALSNRELVDTLYLNVLNRGGETAGVDFWTNAADDPNFSRGQLLSAFAISPENRQESEFVDNLAELDPGIWDFTA